ncbi:MAG: hypothetical protein RLZZ262_484 [Bacteroidota bacterium]|jgi:hypothetical protein
MKFLFITISLILVTRMTGQSIERQLIGSTGFSSQLPNVGLDCSVGETKITFSTNSDITVSEGFLQPQIGQGIQVVELSTNSILVFPNPTRDYFNIQSESTIKRLEMYDSSGRMILTYEPISSFIRISVTLFAQGLYHLKITTTDQVVIHNLQIQ